MTLDERAFETWYRDLHPQLVSVVLASFGDLGLAHEAADEACVRAFERWSSVEKMDSSAGWTVRVALNVAKRKCRRRDLEGRLLRRDTSHVGSGPGVSGPAGELWHVVAELPPRQRQAVALRHVTQMTEAEIATVMGISRGGVSSTLRAAYAALKVELTPDEGTVAHA